MTPTQKSDRVHYAINLRADWRKHSNTPIHRNVDEYIDFAMESVPYFYADEKAMREDNPRAHVPVLIHALERSAYGLEQDLELDGSGELGGHIHRSHLKWLAAYAANYEKEHNVSILHFIHTLERWADQQMQYLKPYRDSDGVLHTPYDICSWRYIAQQLGELAYAQDQLDDEEQEGIQNINRFNW